MKKQIITLVIVAAIIFTLLFVLIVIIPGTTWLYNHRYIIQPEKVVGMTAAEIEEKHGEFDYATEEYFNPYGHTVYIGFYEILPRRPGFLDGKPPYVFAISFQDDVAIKYEIGVHDQYPGSD